MAGNLDLPANVTGEAELHQHDSESEDEKKVPEKKKGSKRKGEIEHKPARNDWIGKGTCNPTEDFPQVLKQS